MIDRRSVLLFSAGFEAATGLALIAVPALVGRLLLGGEITGLGLVVARCFGVALLTLSLAVWPRGAATVQASQAMLLYNTGLAMYLAWLGAAGLAGPILWPAAIIHGLVAALLARPLSAGAGPRANR